MLTGLKRLRQDLEKEVRRKNFEIEEVERQAPGVGVLSGKEAADRWRATFKAEQSGWEAYEQNYCNNVGEFEMYGGSGAGGAQLDCSIILVLRRIAELRDPPL